MDCPDAACRERWVLAHFEAEPQAAVDAIQAVDDPVEKLALVMKVTEAHPGRTANLCDELDEGEARSRCERINARAHLRTPQAAPETSAPPKAVEIRRSAGGPISTRIIVPDDVPSPLAAVEPEPAECESGAEVHTCTAATAASLAEEGRAHEAAAVCASIEGEKWRWECLFHAAEASAHDRGAQGYEDAVNLCMEAGGFATNCQAHVLIMLAQLAPDATSAPSAWEPALAGAEAIRSAWEDRSPWVGEIALDRYWSEALGVAYARASPITGNPLDAIPEAAHRHARAAAAARMMVIDKQDRDLAGWSQDLRDALAQRTSTPREPVDGVLLQAGEDLWRRDMEGDKEYPATFFLGTARRAWDPDPEIDSILCILEVAVRRATGAEPLVDEALQHPAPVVRWTALRLKKAAGRHSGRRRDSTASGPPRRGSLPEH